MSGPASRDHQELVATLSPARLSTYRVATGGDDALGLDLYAWHARVASAMLLPAHFAEVAIRNAVADALETVYGARWPWSPGFERSLPDPARGYSPSRDLRDVRRSNPTTGKVIAELKFAFWQSMFTSRHDRRVWIPHIHGALPNGPAATTPSVLRSRVYGDLEVIRRLRNRVAHHEPILARDLPADLDRIMELIELRSLATAEWVRSIEEVSGLLVARPKPGSSTP